LAQIKALFLTEACFKRKRKLLISPTKQQLVWFRYSANDYTVSNSVIIRVTGIAGTQWKSRLCTDQYQPHHLHHSHNQLI
jgi:hypothetical protein